MRELNEQELELVAGGRVASGNANAGSTANMKWGTYGSASEAHVLVTPRLVAADAANETIASGRFTGSVNSSASTSATIAH